jgi:hypothetical protein
MYYSTSARINDEHLPTIEIEPGQINLHFDRIYLAFTPEEWDALVRAVAKARGLDVSEQPFSGDTIVTIPKEEL